VEALSTSASSSWTIKPSSESSITSSSAATSVISPILHYRDKSLPLGVVRIPVHDGSGISNDQIQYLIQTLVYALMLTINTNNSLIQIIRCLTLL